MMLIIDCGSQKTPFIEQTVDLEMDYKTVKLFDADKNVANDCQGIIISGAPILITEVDNQPYLDQLSWIKEVNIPVLGICFGHQILGLLYEANAARQKEDREITDRI
jgi:GMP synthase (glutamine-hydrolysing)